ncbi:MAG: pentapeptide repeat-containing protein [Sandaracinaceae bacterium]|nr:pentapeptide repeat-containing protein [Sandaracinaceae bacterium]
MSRDPIAQTHRSPRERGMVEGWLPTGRLQPTFGCMLSSRLASSLALACAASFMLACGRGDAEDCTVRGPDAYLRGCDLTNADLTNADLTNANLFSADLTGADLTDANLRYANLRYANLRGADLTGANLTGADLTTRT